MSFAPRSAVLDPPRESRPCGNETGHADGIGQGGPSGWRIVMKVHRNLVEQVVGVLQDVFAGGVPAERAVDGCLKSQGKWGSRDRRMFAESVYDLVRWWRLYWHLADLPAAEFFLPETITAERVWRVWGVYWLDHGHELPPFEELGGVNLAGLTERRAAIPSAAVGASIPDWLDYRGEGELSREWRPLIAALNKPAFRRASKRG